MASSGSLQQNNVVSKLELSCTSTSYKGTQFCLYLICKRKKNAQQHDLWKAATVLPLRICRSGVLLQGKCAALIVSLLAELSQSPHKCNGGRVKFSAKR